MKNKLSKREKEVKMKKQEKKFEEARKKTFGLGNKQPKQKVSQKPVYKSGMLPSGQPRNYMTSKRGIITSLD